LKKMLETLKLLKGSRLFTADATSMYTNIPRDEALRIIAEHLRSDGHRHGFDEDTIEAIIDGLKIVMNNSVFTFGDTAWKQTKGTFMGVPPAPPFANLYYALLKEMPDLLVHFQANLLFYRRFIDDVLGIWISDLSKTYEENETQWLEFKSRMQVRDGLEWVVSDRSEQVDFMDLTISIVGDSIKTTLFEKESSLHLYIPPHSAHPPGMLKGVIFGELNRIHSLCSDPADRHSRALDLYRRLLGRGYKRPDISPIFDAALSKLATEKSSTAATAVRDQEEQEPVSLRPIFLKIQYHPNDPPSSVFQKAFDYNMRNPPRRYRQTHRPPPLHMVRTLRGQPLGLNKMTVCYRRPPNIGNLLSYRTIDSSGLGRPISSFSRRIRIRNEAAQQRENDRFGSLARVIGPNRASHQTSLTAFFDRG
jgi:hypothetical protein